MDYQRIGTDGAFVGGMSRATKKRVAFGVLCAVLLLGGGVGAAVYFVMFHNAGSGSALWASLDASSATVHLQELQNIANMSGGNRACGSVGFNLSLAYVKSQLDAYGSYFDVNVQPFMATTYTRGASNFTVLASAPAASLSLVQAVQFDIVYNTPSASVSGVLTPALNYGCAVSDYGSGVEVALVQRAAANDSANYCTVANATTAAALAGARAVVFVGSLRLIFGTLRGASVAPLPLLSVTTTVGAQLSAAGVNVSVQLVTNGTASMFETANLIATTRAGAVDSAIVVGSHLDSVPAGPGVNDNGSGTSSNLAVALAFARAQLNVTNQVRFAWWGAEELGLLGSTYYVSQLNDTQFDQLLLNINVDMLASPNYVMFVDSVNRNSSVVSNATLGAAIHIEKLFTEFFDAQHVAHESHTIDVPGRSDYAPFLDNGVPAGSLACGAEVLKSPAEQLTFGGLQNAAFDPCYHQFCDTFPQNINNVALQNNLRALAFATQYLAQLENARSWLYDNATVSMSALRRAGALRRAAIDVVPTFWN